MQSHASRHVASEFLKDLHPDYSPPFPKEVIKDEVAVAYGRRSITKLIAVLALDESELSDELRTHALRVFNGLLSTQEHKTDAINQGAAQALTRLVSQSRSFEVRRLSCEALASLAEVLQGRQVIAEAYGIEALTGALVTTPEAAAGAFKYFSSCNDGVGILNRYLDMVVPALVNLIKDSQSEGISLAACINAAKTLSGIATTDQGVESCLKYKVPGTLVGLAQRALTGDLHLAEQCMEGLETVASGLEQIAHHPAGKTALRESDAIKLLAAMLTHCAFHRGAMLCATSALMGVSVEKESKVPVMLYAGQELVRLVQNSTDEYLVANARAAVASASEHLEARSITQSLLTEKEQVQLIFKGPLPPTPPDFRYRVTLPYGTKAAS